jgi:hypothetical protein
VQELLRLDYPMILLRRSRDPAQPPYPVVVSRVADGTATLLDPRVGLVRRPIQVIEQELSGPARLYWRPLNSWRWPGAVDGADPVIHWLQRRLRAAELYRGPMDGLVGPETEQALQRLAGQRGLEVTSTSPLLELLISQLLAPAEFPRLSSPAG